MIGKVYTALFQFYDNKQRKMRFKERPVLIIGDAHNDDYVVLPISTVSNPHNIDGHYDIMLVPQEVSLMKLRATSYIRTHRQTTIHRGQLHKEIVDLRREYKQLYCTIISRVEEFQVNIIASAY